MCSRSQYKFLNSNVNSYAQIYTCSRCIPWNVLLASVSLLIWGKVVHFREARIWPRVFDCFLRVAVCREACYITSAFNRIHTARFSDKEMSPPAIWNMPISRTVANPPRSSVWLAVTAWRLRGGTREAKRSCVSGAPRGSWQDPSSLARGRDPPLSWAGKRGALWSSEQTDWACS